RILPGICRRAGDWPGFRNCEKPNVTSAPDRTRRNCRVGQASLRAPAHPTGSVQRLSALRLPPARRRLVTTVLLAVARQLVEPLLQIGLLLLHLLECFLILFVLVHHVFEALIYRGPGPFAILEGVIRHWRAKSRRGLGRRVPGRCRPRRRARP